MFGNHQLAYIVAYLITTKYCLKQPKQVWVKKITASDKVGASEDGNLLNEDGSQQKENCAARICPDDDSNVQNLQAGSRANLKLTEF